MQKFKDALLEEQQRLEEIIAKAKMENTGMPEGHLRISKYQNRCRYYLSALAYESFSHHLKYKYA